ncbi:MAG: lysylphosphatidylglycerol synthase transmembrane domain-containing protein [Gemmatimonadota bacterium]
MAEAEEGSRSRLRRRRQLGTAIGLGISAVLLWWAVRGLDLPGVMSVVRAAPTAPVVLCVLLATLTFPLRMLRWRTLLSGPGGTRLPVGPAWHAVAIGFMANNILVLRAGEVIRGLVISRLAGIALPAAWASIAIERVFDAMTLVALLVVALAAGALPDGATFAGMSAAQLAGVVATAGVAAFGVGAAVLIWPSGIARIIDRLIPWPALAGRLVALVAGIREGVGALRSPRRLAAAIGWSLVIWGVNAASFLVLFRAFGIELGLAPALVMQAAISFGVAVPSSPGFIGVFEAAIILSLGLYGVDRDTALAYALTYHVTTFFPITLLGMLSVARTPIGWGEVRQVRAR